MNEVAGGGGKMSEAAFADSHPCAAPVFASIEDWHAELVRCFGDDPMGWKFICPSCGHVASVQDWKDAGAPSNAVAFSCIGRWVESTAKIFEKPGPCNYAGGGLFRLNPVEIKGIEIKAFDSPWPSDGGSAR